MSIIKKLSAIIADLETLPHHAKVLLHEHLSGEVGNKPTVKKAPSKKPSRAGETCHWPGCKNPATGPRFRFLCATHREKPKAEQNKALAQWAKTQSK